MKRWKVSNYLIVTILITCDLASTSCSSAKPQLSAKPDKLVLYEGLPHPMSEPEKLAEEKKKPTIEKGGFFFFYQEPLPHHG